MNFARRLSSRTVTKDYRFERKGRRSLRAALEYDTAGMMDSEKTCLLLACLLVNVHCL